MEIVCTKTSEGREPERGKKGPQEHLVEGRRTSQCPAQLQPVTSRTEPLSVNSENGEKL
jgi:hypothetical protein